MNRSSFRVTLDDVDRMRARLYVTSGDDRSRKWSAFWVLLILASVIASAGVIADSTATVIGAMIVAPLMTPILGTALSLVLGDRRELVHNVGLVLAGAAAVIAIGYVMGWVHIGSVVAETNTQVAARVNPRLIDLVGALATGAVGAFALVRSDVSDALPGVAIAISLVPPLAVVGLTLESGSTAEALGALLLFTTNVAAIIATGTLVFLGARLRTHGGAGDRGGEPFSRATAAVVGAAVILVSIPLAFGTWQSAREQVVVSRAQPVAEAWAERAGWSVSKVALVNGTLMITAVGRPPEAPVDALRADLDSAGLADVDATVTLVLGGSQEVPSTAAP